MVAGFLVSRGCCKRFLTLAISTPRRGSLTIAFIGKFVFIYVYININIYIYILYYILYILYIYIYRHI